MGYDLYFTGRDVTASEFFAYFSARKYYQVDSSQAIYRNEDTGVYFIFDHTTEIADDPETPKSSISLALNFVRPHIFALEAEPEIAALIDAFSFTVFDPQNSGMGTGPYSREGFLQGWNAGNEFGIHSILQEPDTAASVYTYPSGKLEQCWKWNLDREAVQTQLGDGIYVPKIMFLKKEKMATSSIVWGDAIPTLIPQVDYILIPRNDLAPRSFFRTGKDTCLIQFQEVVEDLGRYRTNDFGMSALRLPSQKSPAIVVDFVKKLKPFEGKIEGISVDKVLDQELVDRSRMTS